MSSPAKKPDSGLFTYGLPEWQREPGAAFDAFLSGYRFEGRALRPSTFRIYRGMFARLQRWAQEQGQSWLALDEATLALFLQGRGLGAESRHRYLLLLTTLFSHLARLQEGASHEGLNPARALLLEHEAPAREEPEWLSESELSAFLAAATLPPNPAWKRVRDKALLGTVLGAGLRSSEVLALKTPDIQRKQEFLSGLWVQAHKPHPARHVPLQAVGQGPLQAWLSLRQTLGVAGTLVFPANLAGAALTPVTLFRLVKHTLARAQLVKRYEGPTLLRNTCGVQWLRTHEPLQVMQWLGHATERTTELLLPPEKRTSSSAQAQLAQVALQALAR